MYSANGNEKLNLDQNSANNCKVTARRSAVLCESGNSNKMSDNVNNNTSSRSNGGGVGDASKFCDNLVDDLIDFTTILDNKVNERREDPLVAKKRASEMYNEEIEFMNNYLKSLPNFNDQQPGQGQQRQTQQQSRGGEPKSPQQSTSQFNSVAENFKNPSSIGSNGYFLAKSVSSNSIHPPTVYAKSSNHRDNGFQTTNHIQYNNYGGSQAQQPMVHYPQRPQNAPVQYSANAINKSTSSSHIPFIGGVAHLHQPQHQQPILNSSQHVDPNVATAPPPVFRRGLAKSFSSNAAFSKILPSPSISSNHQNLDQQKIAEESYSPDANAKRLSDFWSDNLSSSGRPKTGWNYKKIVEGSGDDLRGVAVNEHSGSKANTVIKPMETTMVNLSRGSSGMGYVPTKIHQNTELMKQQMRNEEKGGGRSPGLARTMSHNIPRLVETNQQQHPQDSGYRSAFAQVQTNINNNIQNLVQPSYQQSSHNVPGRSLSKSSSFSCVTSQMPTVKVTEMNTTSFPPPAVLLQQQPPQPPIKKSSSSASIFNSKLLSFMKPQMTNSHNGVPSSASGPQGTRMVPLSKCSSAATLKTSPRQIENANQTAKNNFFDSKPINYGGESKLTVVENRQKEQQQQQALKLVKIPVTDCRMGNQLPTANANGSSEKNNKSYSNAAPAVPIRRLTTSATVERVTEAGTIGAKVAKGDQASQQQQNQGGGSSGGGIKIRSMQTQQQPNTMAVIATVSTTSSKAPSCAEKFFVTQTMPPANKVVVNYPSAVAHGVATSTAQVTQAPNAEKLEQQAALRVKDVTVKKRPDGPVAMSSGNPVMRTPSMKDARKNATAIQSDVARDLEKNLTELLNMNKARSSPKVTQEQIVKPSLENQQSVQKVIITPHQPIYSRSKNLSYSDILLKSGGKVMNSNLLNVNKNNILPLTTTTKYLLPTSSSSFCYKGDGAKGGGVALVNKTEDLQRVKQDLYNSHEIMKRNKLKTVKEVSSSSSASGSQNAAVAAMKNQAAPSGTVQNVPSSGRSAAALGQNQQLFVAQFQQPIIKQPKVDNRPHYPLATSSSIGWFPSALQPAQQQPQYQMRGYPQQQQYALIKKPSLHQGVNFNQMGGQVIGSNHSNGAMMIMAGGSSRMLQKSATQIMVN